MRFLAGFPVGFPAGRVVILFGYAVLLSVPLCNAAIFHPKPQAVAAHIRVGIRNAALAKRSLAVPSLIPLLHGNSIISYRRRADHFEIAHSPKVKTELFPVTRRHGRHVATGFVFKQSSFGAYPVPMEHSMVLVRLTRFFYRRRRTTIPLLQISVVSYGVYTPAQRLKQRIFIHSMVNEFADNARRVLGVAGCGHFATISGLCNNKRHTVSGTSIHNLLLPKPCKRPSTKAMARMTPNVRVISDGIMKSSGNKDAPFKTNMLFVIFGQFLDHEIVSSTGELVDQEAKLPILDPKTKTQMEFTRSGILRYQYNRCCRAKYYSGQAWRYPTFNRHTSFIDGGAVYGTTHLRATVLRSFKGGKLRMRRVGSEMFMPRNDPTYMKFALSNEPDSHDKTLFVAGDSRANENALLLAMHTLFAREHNRVCRLLQKWLLRYGRRASRLQNDEWLYLTAKQIVAAEMQSITFNEFVPRLLGPKALPRYKRYNSRVDARISVFHSAFAYRFGHSAIRGTFQILDRNGKIVSVKLQELFFNPTQFFKFGMDNLVDSMIDSPAEAVDHVVVDSLRDFLFNPERNHVLDLAALNMHRLRDLGIPSYLQMQAIYRCGTGLNNIPAPLRTKLIELYGSASKIDAFVGGLCEEPKSGSLVGPLFWEINREQFLRLRDGDRFYYGNKKMKWHPWIANMPLVQKIRNGQFKMADVVLANTELDRRHFHKTLSMFATNSRI